MSFPKEDSGAARGFRHKLVRPQPRLSSAWIRQNGCRQDLLEGGITVRHYAQKLDVVVERGEAKRVEEKKGILRGIRGR